MKIETQFEPGDTVFKAWKSFETKRVVDTKCTCGEHVTYRSVRTEGLYEIVERVIEYIEIFINKDGTYTIEYMGNTNVGHLGKNFFKTQKAAETYIAEQEETKI